MRHLFFVAPEPVAGARSHLSNPLRTRRGGSEALELYRDSGGWARKAILNVAASGNFRAIALSPDTSRCSNSFPMP